MKINVTFKTPDALEESIIMYQEGLTDEELEKARHLMKRYIK